MKWVNNRSSCLTTLFRKRREPALVQALGADVAAGQFVRGCACSRHRQAAGSRPPPAKVDDRFRRLVHQFRSAHLVQQRRETQEVRARIGATIVHQASMRHSGTTRHWSGSSRYVVCRNSPLFMLRCTTTSRRSAISRAAGTTSSAAPPLSPSGTAFSWPDVERGLGNGVKFAFV